MPDEPYPVRPSPDPTTLTSDAIARVVQQRADLTTAQLEVVEAKFAIIRERITGIDKATALFQETLIRVPTDVDKQVSNLKALHEERFHSIAQQFEERDKRGERESRDNKVAVDAAFAAQKEAASEQNKSNTLAISKSEGATAETILKLEQLVSANIQGLNDKVDDLKSTAALLRSEMITNANAIRQEVIALQSRRDAHTESRTESKASVNMIGGLIGSIVAVILLGLALYGALKA